MLSSITDNFLFWEISTERLGFRNQKWILRMRKSQHTREYRRLIQLLRRAREEAGLTQETAASRLGTYASFISKIESCERRLDIMELKIFCDMYRVDLADFLRRAGLLG